MKIPIIISMVCKLKSKQFKKYWSRLFAVAVSVCASLNSISIAEITQGEENYSEAYQVMKQDKGTLSELRSEIMSYESQQFLFQCAKLKSGHCKANELSQAFQLNLNSCELITNSQECKNLVKKNPELRENLKKCDPEGYCSETFFKSYFKLSGCLSGYWEGTKELFEGIETKNRYLRACDRSIECKRNLVKDVPRYNKLTDEKLNKFSSAFLQIEANNYNYAVNKFQIGSTKSLSLYERAEKAEKLSQEKNQMEASTPNLKLDISQLEEGIKSAAKKLWEDTGIKFDCFDARSQREMICYGASKFIDPIVVAGAGTTVVLKSQNLTKLLKFFKDDKTPDANRRIGSNVPHHTTAEREFLKSQLLHAQYTTEKQNLQWMHLADQPLRKNMNYVEIENAKLKFLNDSLKDKDLVTSMTNMHKQITMEEFDKLAKKYPKLKMQPYSDFKSVRFAFQGKPPIGFEQDLNKAFANVQSKFTDWAKNNKLVRDSDSPDTWFKMGYGNTADEASAAARYARSAEVGDSGFSFNNPTVKMELQNQLNETEKLRMEVIKSVKSTAMLEDAGRGNQVLKKEVFQILSKSDNTVEATERIKVQFGLKELSVDQTQKMMDYMKSVDRFSPSLHIAKREVASLDAAEHGGFSVDFVGMGAQNVHATANALAKKSDLTSALIDTRKAEKEVTELFVLKKDSVKEISNSTIGNRVTTVCSGDDCVGTMMAPLTKSEKQKLIDNFANQMDGASVRVSFIQPNIKNVEARTQLATHGESVEKNLRNRLSDKIPPRKLKGLLFAVDMKTTEVGKGTVSLMQSQASGIRLTSKEKVLIQKSFRDAVKDLNSNLTDLPGYTPNY